MLRFQIVLARRICNIYLSDYRFGGTKYFLKHIADDIIIRVINLCIRRSEQIGKHHFMLCSAVCKQKHNIYRDRMLLAFFVCSTNLLSINWPLWEHHNTTWFRRHMPYGHIKRAEHMPKRLIMSTTLRL